MKALILTTALVATSALATPALDSNDKATAILERALEAHGGLNARLTIATIDLDYEGTVYDYGQSESPSANHHPRSTKGRIIVDRSNAREMIWGANTFRGGPLFEGRSVYTSNGGFVYSETNNQIHDLSTFEVGLSRAANQGSPARMLPFVVLAQAANARASVRYLGSTQRDDKHYEVITFVDAGNGQVSLYIDPSDASVDYLETINDDLLLGRTTQTVAYADVKEVEGVPTPHAWTFYTGDVLIESRLATRIEINGELDTAMFDRPENAIPNADPVILKPVALADNVYLLHQWSGFNFNYNSLLVALDGESVMIEAPLADRLMAGAKGVIAGLLPEHPLSTVVVTHYHHDHLGGINAFFDGSVEILAPADTVPFLQKLAEVDHPLTGTVGKREPRVSPLTPDRRFETSGVTLELITVGPTPHVDSLVLGWIPEYGILYVTDLFGTSHGGVLPKASPNSTWLAQWIAEHQLAVKTIVPAHGQVVPYDTFLNVVDGTFVQTASND